MDIVERLREHAKEPYHPDEDGALASDAADEIAWLRQALRIIAGYEQCLDNLMSNADVAREALKSR